jgi:hypothetical protein
MRYSFIAMRTVLIYCTKSDVQLAVSLFCAVGVAATTMGLPTILHAHTHTHTHTQTVLEFMWGGDNAYWPK